MRAVTLRGDAQRSGNKKHRCPSRKSDVGYLRPFPPRHSFPALPPCARGFFLGNSTFPDETVMNASVAATSFTFRLAGARLVLPAASLAIFAHLRKGRPQAHSNSRVDLTGPRPEGAGNPGSTSGHGICGRSPLAYASGRLMKSSCPDGSLTVESRRWETKSSNG